MPFTETLTDYLDTAEFATSAVFSGSGATVSIIFDDEFHDPIGMADSEPIARGRAEDFPGNVRGQTLTIGAVIYKITKIMPDGTGMVDLALQKVS